MNARTDAHARRACLHATHGSFDRVPAGALQCGGIAEIAEQATRRCAHRVTPRLAQDRFALHEGRTHHAHELIGIVDAVGREFNGHDRQLATLGPRGALFHARGRCFEQLREGGTGHFPELFAQHIAQAAVFGFGFIATPGSQQQREQAMPARFVERRERHELSRVSQRLIEVAQAGVTVREQPLAKDTAALVFLALQLDPLFEIGGVADRQAVQEGALVKGYGVGEMLEVGRQIESRNAVERAIRLFDHARENVRVDPQACFGTQAHDLTIGLEKFVAERIAQVKEHALEFVATALAVFIRPEQVGERAARVIARLQGEIGQQPARFRVLHGAGLFALFDPHRTQQVERSGGLHCPWTANRHHRRTLSGVAPASRIS
nr:hypothetical protein [Pandoraea apista]